jgi:lipoprotein-releasing system ATP-binding protein
MSEYALELAGIEKVYKRGTAGEVAVLRGATLEVKRGEVVALVAPSGAGKSTLLHIAGLLDTPDAGSVALSGRNMVGLSDRDRTLARRGEVGFIYQFHHLLPEFTALENIVIPQLANGVAEAEAEARARDLLERVGVAARAEGKGCGWQSEDVFGV